MKYIFSARVLKALKLDWKYGERMEVAVVAAVYLSFFTSTTISIISGLTKII